MLFPGFGRRQDLHSRNIEYYIGDLLDGLLDKLAHQDDPALRLEAVRTLGEHPSPRRIPLLRAIAGDERMGDAVRAQAILGLAERAQDLLDDLLRLARGDNAIHRDETLRALVGTKFDMRQRTALEEVARRP